MENPEMPGVRALSKILALLFHAVKPLESSIFRACRDCAPIRGLRDRSYLREIRLRGLFDSHDDQVRYGNDNAHDDRERAGQAFKHSMSSDWRFDTFGR
jgi:hypothetical protein